MKIGPRLPKLSQKQKWPSFLLRHGVMKTTLRKTQTTGRSW